MTPEENDPDTLQLLDELDADWVRFWRSVADKKKLEEELILFVLRTKTPVPTHKNPTLRSQLIS
jgi:hypothetical protein